MNTAAPTDASADRTIGPATVDGRALYAMLTGGVAGTDHQLKFTAVGTAGKTWPRTALVLCAETSRPMPADDLVLNVRQIAGYNNGLSAEGPTPSSFSAAGLAARICSSARTPWWRRRWRRLRPVHGRAGGAIRRRRTAYFHRRHPMSTGG